MKMRENGRRLKVRWSTEEWTPAIKLLAGASRSETRAEARALSLEWPLQKRIIRRRKQVLWTRGVGRMSGLSGLNSSRTSWR